MAQPLAATFELCEWSVIRTFAKRRSIGGAADKTLSGLQNLGHLEGIRFPVRCGMKLPAWLDLLV